MLIKNLLKKFVFSAFLATVIITISCQREGPVSPSQESKYKDLTVKMPFGVSDKVLLFTREDLKNLYYSSNSTSRLDNNIAPVTLGEYISILNKVKVNYPNTSNIDDNEIEKIICYFPELDKKGVYQNIDTITDFFEKLISYDAVKEITKINSRSARYPYDLNSCEFWYIAEHPRMADGLQTATNLAFQYELQVTGAPANNYLGYGDAIRHAMWSALVGKYACNSYGTVDKAAEQAIGFLSMHECGVPEGPDKEMDLHNNQLGNDFYRSRAKRVKVSCFLGICNYNVLFEGSDQDLINGITSKAVIQTNDINVMKSTSASTLIRIN